MNGILSLLLTLAGMGLMFYLGAQWSLRRLRKALAVVDLRLRSRARHGRRGGAMSELDIDAEEPSDGAV